MYSQSSANERQYQGINRTICIGLGGTGRDVLMRIRRLIVDRYEDLNNLPVVSFVHIDTDKKAMETTGLPTGNMYQGVELGFTDAEKVNATMTANEVDRLDEGLDQYYSNPNQPNPYKHIALWFPPQLKRNVKAIDEGAKGIRPVGRLAFFHHYLTIKNAIDIAERGTRGHEQELLRNFGLIVDPGLNIVVVGSLCGGTGSGIFLDVAYSLRYAYPDVRQLIGYLVISPELYGNTPNMCANTYAALMELDYYSSPGTQFQACYNQDYLTFVQEKRPPFHYTYLVSNYTKQRNYAIGEQPKLCNVIANKIALDFSSELAPVVKGMRDNFAQHLIQEDDHPRPNSQNYLTFGLAAVYFPRDRISQITVAKINSKLVSFWLQGEGQSPDPLKLLEQFLIEFSWHNDLERKDGLFTRLEATALESEKNFNIMISSWKTKQENSISECKNKDDRSSLMRQLQREFKEQFHKVKFGNDESSRGIWLTKLLKSRTTLTSQLCQDIDNYLFGLLTPTNQYFSIANARNWIDAIQTELNAYQYNFEEQIKELNSARNIEELDKKWSEINRSIQDIEEEKFSFNFNKNGRVQDTARRAVKETETAIKHNFELAIAQQALKIIKDLQHHTQARTSQLTDLYRLVDDLKNHYQKNQATLKQSNSDGMSGEEIFSDEDIDICYNTLLPQKEYRAQVVQITRQILERTDSGQSLEIFLEQNRLNLAQLQEEIDSTVNPLFSSRITNIVQSVIKRFNQKYQSSERAVRLGQIIREAQPLLPLNLTAPYFHDDPAKKSELIGFEHTKEPEVEQFRTVLTKNLGILDNVLKPTQAKDKVLIVTEYAAFPLRLIDGLQQLQYHYLLQRKTGNTLLHNDRDDIFTDIIPPRVQEMQRLQDIFYPCLAFDLIPYNQKTRKLEFQYFDKLRGAYHTASLSPAWNSALEKLVNNPNMAAALQELLDGAIAEIEREPAKWEECYLPKLRQFLAQVDNLPDNDINYPYRSRVVNLPEINNTFDTFAKPGIIERFMVEMQKKVKVLPGQNNASLALPESQKVITSEVVVEPVVDSTDNRTKRRLELEQLKKDIEDGIITQEEYENERQKIINKYPL